MATCTSPACPYCKHNNSIGIDVSKIYGQNIVCCDDGDGGGCGRYYAVFWHVTIQIESKAIEGMADDLAQADEADGSRRIT